MQSKIHLDSFEEYRTSVLNNVRKMLTAFYGEDIPDIARIKKDVKEINAYPNLSHLKPVSEEQITMLEEGGDTRKAEEAILAGKVFWEHTAAGEATRLGLGTKYLLNLKQFAIPSIVKHMRDEAIADLKKQGLGENAYVGKVQEIYSEITERQVLEDAGCRPDALMNLSLGARHMLQLAFEIRRIAKNHGQDPSEVLRRQRMLIVVNEATAEEIIEGVKQFHYFGFDPEKLYFMVQRAFHGIYVKEGQLFFDTTTELNKRLHNHGQMMMQKAQEDVIFSVANGQRRYLSASDFEGLLQEHDDYISFNIEDLSYLTHAIDLDGLSLALDLREQGYNMAMEVVSQNPKKPQKGGACFYDEVLGRPVMIESNRLRGIQNEEITHLNKNINHYMDPSVCFRELKENGLPITFDVKTMLDHNGDPEDYIYPSPVQGDMNFLVTTAFVMRRNVKSILAWKSPATTPSALREMKRQDEQEGFRDFVDAL